MPTPADSFSKESSLALPSQDPLARFLESDGQSVPNNGVVPQQAIEFSMPYSEASHFGDTIPLPTQTAGTVQPFDIE